MNRRSWCLPWTPGTMLRLSGMPALLLCSTFFAAAQPKSEPLGPCSRKTGLVISEIMHRPAARDDDYQLEFLEIYNSNPFFEDVSAYRLVFGVKIRAIFPQNTVIPAFGFLVVA